MRRVEIFIAENFVNGKIFRRLERFLKHRDFPFPFSLRERERKTNLLRQFVEHARADGGGVSSENVFLRFFQLPLVLITDRTEGAAAMNLTNFLHVIRRQVGRHRRIREKECVLSIARRMFLRREKRVETPETVLDEIVRRHFGETEKGEVEGDERVRRFSLPHFQEDLSIFRSDFQQRV